MGTVTDWPTTCRPRSVRPRPRGRRQRLGSATGRIRPGRGTARPGQRRAPGIAMEQISTLLDVCHGLRVVMTSRIPLAAAGERLYPRRALDQGDAVVLLIERARAHHPDGEPPRSSHDAPRSAAFREVPVVAVAPIIALVALPLGKSSTARPTNRYRRPLWGSQSARLAWLISRTGPRSPEDRAI